MKVYVFMILILFSFQTVAVTYDCSLLEGGDSRNVWQRALKNNADFTIDSKTISGSASLPDGFSGGCQAYLDTSFPQLTCWAGDYKTQNFVELQKVNSGAIASTEWGARVLLLAPFLGESLFLICIKTVD